MKVVNYILSMWILWTGVGLCCLIYQILNGFSIGLTVVEIIVGIMVSIQIIKEVRDDGI